MSRSDPMELGLDENTLVEVKRSTDTRIRGEVVAQMLDYGADSLHNACERMGYVV